MPDSERIARIEAKVDALSAAAVLAASAASSAATAAVAAAGELHSFREEFRRVVYGNGAVGLVEKVRRLIEVDLPALAGWQSNHDHDARIDVIARRLGLR